MVMVENRRTRHLAAALRWSAHGDVAWLEALASGLAMALPVGLGAVLGHLGLGLAASLGGLIVGGGATAPTARLELGRSGGVLASAVVASVAAALIGGHGWVTGALVAAVATAAAVLGSYSRGLAVASSRLVLLMVLCVPVADGARYAAALVAAVFAGAIGGAAVRLLIGALGRRAIRDHAGEVAAEPTIAAVSRAQKYARWRRVLAQRAGWQYPLRLGIGLAMAAVAQVVWPLHHLHWIALVVVLLTERTLEPLPIKTTQRALGTVIGVAAASVLLAGRPPTALLIIAIGVLAGLRPVLKARSYLAYSAVMTPLVVLIMSADRPLDGGLLIDRLLATFAAAAIVTAANLVAVCWLAGARGSGAQSRLTR